MGLKFRHLLASYVINAQIFLVETFGGNEFITQVIGKGIHEIEYKVVFVFLIFFLFLSSFFYFLPEFRHF